MKVIIAGSRRLRQYSLVGAAVASSGSAISEVISGGASGIDQLAIRWARDHEVPVTVMAADWRRWAFQSRWAEREVCSRRTPKSVRYRGP